MTELLTAAQMRKVEQAAIKSGVVTGLELMERAGLGVVDVVDAEWPDMDLGLAIVLCGPGNNGGDGFVIARLLSQRGWQVEVYLYGDLAALPPDAKTNGLRWQEMGQIGDVAALYDRHGRNSDRGNGGTEGLCFGGQPVLFVDALFGTGLTRPVETALAQFLADARAHGPARIVAVDMPSGHCADSGRALGSDSVLDQAAGCALTVTFHRPKTGHVTLEGARACGRLRIVDIELDAAQACVNRSASADDARGPALWIGGAGIGGAGQGDAAPSIAWSALSKSVDAHKYAHGHALVLSGPPGKGGAARLAARGALRVGAGVVTVGCPMRAVPEHAAQLNAIMIHGLDGTHGLVELLEDTRINALCLGPGLGLGAATGELVKSALAARRSTVLDADALSRFQRQPDVLFQLLHDKCVLTPHAGEFRRLFPDLADRLSAASETGPAYSKLDATRDAAARAGCVVLFKGPDTVVADQNGRCAIVPALFEDAAPWLATAGAGDVLAGIITGLLARGQSAICAAQMGAWLHAAAARAFGPGLIAEDLPEALPQVFRALILVQ